MSQNPGPSFVPAPEPYGYPPQQVARESYGAPVQQTWTQPYVTSAPQLQHQPQPYVFTAPAHLYGQPGPGFLADPRLAGYGFVPAAAARKRPMLGIVALAMTCVALVVLCIFMATWGTLQGQLAPDGNLTDQQTAIILGRVGLGVLLSSLVGFAGWVVGIVATAINHGRAFGIATIILGVLAPIIGFVAMVIALFPYA